MNYKAISRHIIPEGKGYPFWIVTEWRCWDDGLNYHWSPFRRLFWNEEDAQRNLEDTL